MAETVNSSLARVEYVTIYKGKCRFVAYVMFKSFDSRIIEAHDHVMAIDKCTVTLVKQDSAVSYNST
jgi:hypothetical protein